jgi:hypothetical protein
MLVEILINGFSLVGNFLSNWSSLLCLAVESNTMMLVTHEYQQNLL